MKQAIQIPRKISPGIFALPCVTEARKAPDGSAYYALTGYLKDGVIHDVTDSRGYERYFAGPGEWLCQDDDGQWLVLFEKEYRERNAPLSKMETTTPPKTK